MDIERPVAPLCVYTIAHSERLKYFYNLGGVGELTEGKRWARAQALLKAAKLFDMRFLVLFAAAEDPDRLIFYATLDTIDLLGAGDGHARTDYQFSDLVPFPAPGPLKTALINEATRKPIPSAYSRPYLICQTPDWIVLPRVEMTKGHQTHSRRLR